MFIFITNCKQKSDSISSTESKKVAPAVAPNPNWELSMQNATSANELAQMRLNAQDILTFRKKELLEGPATILEKDAWLMKAYIVGKDGKFGDKLNNAWIDFSEDFTYTYGHNDKKEGSGEYVYNFEKEQLLLIDDNQTMKPQEFKVSITNNDLLLVGSEIYRDNALQVKFVRKSNQGSIPPVQNGAK